MPVPSFLSFVLLVATSVRGIKESVDLARSECNSRARESCGVGVVHSRTLALSVIFFVSSVADLRLKGSTEVN